VDAVTSPAYCLAKHLTELLTPSIGNTNPEDIIVSSNVLPLCIHVPFKKTLYVLGQEFSRVIMSLFLIVLTLTYFLFSGQL
jgi:hypothetical protein